MSTPCSMLTCTCGHAPEEHGNDSDHPGSTACDECPCIAYEADLACEADDGGGE